MRALALAALLLPEAALADQPVEVVVISDPKSGKAADTLLANAVMAELARHPGWVLVSPFKASTKVARSLKQLEQADATRRAARAQFDSLELDAAVREYQKALKTIERVIAASPDLRPLTETLSMLGASYLLLGQAKRARQVMERLHTLDPDFAPDETVYNPNMLEEFDEVGAKTRAQRLAQLSINADPTGAAVYVDGRFVGVAPVTVELPRGKHFVRVLHPGHEALGRAVDVKRDDVAVSLALSRVAGNEPIEALMTEAVKHFGDGVMPDEALDIADLAGAKEVVIVAAGSPHKLVRYQDGGKQRVENEHDGPIANADDARRAARKLLKLPDRPDRGPKIAAKPSTKDSSAAPADADDDEAEGGRSRAREEDGEDDGGQQRVAAVEANGKNEDERPEEPESPDPDGALSFLSPYPSKAGALAGLYGGAVVLAAVGGVFGYLALAADGEYNSELVLENSGEIDHDRTLDQVEGQEVAKAGARNAVIADVMYATAGACAIAGILLHAFWNPGAGGSGASAATVRFGAGGLRVEF